MDYSRYQNEIARQKAEMEAEKRRRGSFGQRALRGLGGALKGGLMGAMTMNPYIAAGGAAAGFAGGALDDGSGGQNAGTMIGQSIPLAAMAASRGSSYLSSGSGGAANPAAVEGSSSFVGPPSSAPMAANNGAFYGDSAGLGSLSPEEYRRYMDGVAQGRW
jgi:hypothetical protein